MYNEKYSLLSYIQPSQLNLLNKNLDCISSLIELVKEIDGEFVLHSFTIAHYTTYETFLIQLNDLYKIYKMKFPQGNLGSFFRNKCYNFTFTFSNDILSNISMEGEDEKYIFLVYKNHNSNEITSLEKIKGFTKDDTIHYYSTLFDKINRLHSSFTFGVDNKNKNLIEWPKKILKEMNIDTDENKTSQHNKLIWKGSQTEFMELIKALIENGTLLEKQKDIIDYTSKFFNIEIKNPDKLLTDIKKRNIGSETLYIDKLKSSLYNYITKENRR